MCFTVHMSPRHEAGCVEKESRKKKQKRGEEIKVRL